MCTEQRVVKGTKGVIMDWPDFEEHHKEKWKWESAKDISNAWGRSSDTRRPCSEVEMPGFKDRVPVDV